MSRHNFIVSGAGLLALVTLAACGGAAATPAPAPTLVPVPTDPPAPTAEVAPTAEAAPPVEERNAEAPADEQAPVEEAAPEIVLPEGFPSQPAAVGESFRPDRPEFIAATGRPQLLEFFTFW